MDIHRGISADQGETAPGSFEHHGFRSLCGGLRIESGLVVLDGT